MYWETYEVLAEFDEDAAIVLEHSERPLGASLVACFEHVLLLSLILGLFSCL